MIHMAHKNFFVELNLFGIKLNDRKYHLVLYTNWHCLYYFTMLLLLFATTLVYFQFINAIHFKHYFLQKFAFTVLCLTWNLFALYRPRFRTYMHLVCSVALLSFAFKFY